MRTPSQYAPGAPESRWRPWVVAAVVIVLSVSAGAVLGTVGIPWLLS